MIIAANFRIGGTYNQRLIAGIIRFVTGHTGIKLCFTDPDYLQLPGLDSIDGIIGTPFSGGLIKKPISVPLVNAASRSVLGAPTVHCDHEQIVGMALGHFADFSIRHLAYLHIDGHQDSAARRAFFEAGCRDRGSYPYILHCDAESAKMATNTTLKNALLALPKPAGLLLPVDRRGPALLQLCHDLKISVPEDIAVLGIDNDSDLCMSCSPPLSSIDIDVPQIGYIAAKTVVALIEGDDVPATQLIGPKELIKRNSSLPQKTFSPGVANVIDFLHANLGAPLVMEDLVRQQHLGRRALEKTFHVEVGEAPMRHLRTLRLARVKYLLRTTDSNVSEISRRCGFPHTTYLCRIFRTAFGVTPLKFRKGREESDQ